MEATSARMASRASGFEGFAPPKTTLQRFIFNACDPMSNYEPNLALNLEIVDLINSKKGNAPREAAFTIVQLVNHRNPNVSLLALALLDNCVKNCGYPFHLQISTKDFLNELVRRFPERPPPRPSRVQNKILEAIEEWHSTICQTSKYKDDLGFIRDMHRLLLYKGYMFPEVRRDDAAVLNPSDHLQSAEEMEEEERTAQSAKLQELIRRGGPHDLQEANRLMKVMAGYDTRHKTNYRAKAAEEVAKVQQKAKLLEEMLQNHREGDKVGDGDVFDELAGALSSAHPKIQKMCEDESDDAEAVAKLLQINDSINRTVQRYRLMKAGNMAAANKIEAGTLGTTTGVGKNAANELSLIDFDPEPAASSNSAPVSTPAAGTALFDLAAGPARATQAPTSSVEDDLLGLSLDSEPQGGLSLGPSASSGAAAPFPFALSSASARQAPPHASTPQSPLPPLPPQQPQQPLPSKPNYDAFASLTSALPASKPASPQPPSHGQKAPATLPPPTDPFAALVSPSPRSSTPSQPSTLQPQSQPHSLLSLSQNRTASPLPPTQATSTTGDDEWNFASSLPEAPASHTVRVLSSDIDIDFTAQRQPDQPLITIHAQFSNSTHQPLTDLVFQVAVEKSYSLKLRPQTSRALAPNQRNAVQQEILLSDVPPGKGSSVKMRYKLSYQIQGQNIEQQGNVPSLGIS
ncbi:hypothetical protein DV737_g850, partial [Chaetothyriales sp. CBS 132003]